MLLTVNKLQKTELRKLEGGSNGKPELSYIRATGNRNHLHKSNRKTGNQSYTASAQAAYTVSAKMALRRTNC